MNRAEALQRIATASVILQRECGWTTRQIDALIGGLPREDAVEEIERFVLAHTQSAA